MTRPDPPQFHYHTMPPPRAALCKLFAELAGRIASAVPANSDSDAALEKLLDARNLVLRAHRQGDALTSETQPELDFGEGAGPAFEADQHRLLDPG